MDEDVVSEEEEGGGVERMKMFLGKKRRGELGGGG